MSVRQQPRGRTVARRRSGQSRVFYIILAVVLIVGVAVIGIVVMQARQNTPAADVASRTLNAPVGQTPEGYWYKGQPDAPVTVIDYSDFECPYCANFANTQEATIDKLYVETGKVKYVFHDYPLPMHANAFIAAEAARCAADQNAFWPMHNLLYAKQTEWAELSSPKTKFASYADSLKLDATAFSTCLDSGKYQAALQAAQDDSAKNGINATPTFTIDGKSYDSREIKAAIDAALAAKGK